MAGLAAILIAVGTPAVAAQEIDGYRSARFGMSEFGVLDAIEADFGIARDAVARSTQPMEKTVVLTIFIENLVDGTGRTEIAYILGYRSRVLIQVNLVWRLAPDAAADTGQLLRAADAMINRLALRGVPRVEIQPDTVMDNGAILLFRGQDDHGRLVLIELNRPGVSEGSQSAAVSSGEGVWLRVSFVERADAPDVYKIEPGQF